MGDARPFFKDSFLGVPLAALGVGLLRGSRGSVSPRRARRDRPFGAPSASLTPRTPKSNPTRTGKQCTIIFGILFEPKAFLR